MKTSLCMKGIAVGIIGLMLLIAIPSTVRGNQIEFPKDNGPYLIYLSGWSLCESPADFVTISKDLANIGPFVICKYPIQFQCSLFRYTTVIMVNGHLYSNMIDQDHNRLLVKGFVGWSPAFPLVVLKTTHYLRLRIVGICQELDFDWQPYSLT